MLHSPAHLNIGLVPLNNSNYAVSCPVITQIDLFLLESIHAGSRAHAAVYFRGTGVVSPGVKQPGLGTVHLTATSSKVDNVLSVPLHHSTQLTKYKYYLTYKQNTSLNTRSYVKFVFHRRK
jgi:hypothetical protein